MAIVAVAVIRIGRRALKNEVMWSIAALAFVAIYFFKVPFPSNHSDERVSWASLAAECGSQRVQCSERGTASPAEAPRCWTTKRNPPPHTRPSCQPSDKGYTHLACPVDLRLRLRSAYGKAGTTLCFAEGIFFSKAAVVTFGGAYAVLPYVAQQALSHYGWLKPGPNDGWTGIG